MNQRDTTADFRNQEVFGLLPIGGRYGALTQEIHVLAAALAMLACATRKDNASTLARPPRGAMRLGQSRVRCIGAQRQTLRALTNF